MVVRGLHGARPVYLTGATAMPLVAPRTPAALREPRPLVVAGSLGEGGSGIIATLQILEPIATPVQKRSA